MSKQKRFKLLLDLFALSGGQLLGKMIGFIAFAYLARALDPEAYGAVEYAVGLAVFFATIVDWGLGPIGVREISAAPHRASVLGALIPAARLGIALVGIPLMGLTTAWSGHPDTTVQLVWLFSLSLLALPWKQDWLLQGREMMMADAIGQLLRMSGFALGVVLFVHTTNDILRVGMVEIAAAALGSIYYLVVQQIWITPVRLRFAAAELRHLVQEGISVGLANFLWAVIQYVPLFFVANFAGASQTAWFGASHRIVVSLLTFSWLYHTNLYPAIARRVGEKPGDFEELMRASFRVVAWSGICLTLVLTLLARPLLVLAFGAEFAVAAPAFAVLIWTVPATLLSGHARWALVATGNQRYVLYAHVAGAATALVVGAAAIPLVQSVGAATAMLAATMVVWAVAHACAVARIGRLPSLSIAGSPALLAIVWSALAHVVEATPWVAALGAVVLFALSAPLLDGKLIADLRRLAHAKADLGRTTEVTS